MGTAGQEGRRLSVVCPKRIRSVLWHLIIVYRRTKPFSSCCFVAEVWTELPEAGGYRFGIWAEVYNTPTKQIEDRIEQPETVVVGYNSVVMVYGPVFNNYISVFNGYISSVNDYNSVFSNYNPVFNG